MTKGSKLKLSSLQFLYVLSLVIPLILIYMTAPTAIRGLDPYSLYDESTRGLAEINYNMFQGMVLIFLSIVLEGISTLMHHLGGKVAFFSNRALDMGIRSLVLGLAALVTMAYLYFLRPEIGLRMILMLLNLSIALPYCFMLYSLGKYIKQN